VLVIRPATASDQSIIVELVRRARLNPRSLDWQRFLVAEEHGAVIGIRQVKVHRAGTRELASGFVLPEHRRRGISARLMYNILERETGALYLMCDRERTGYYESFGFRRVPSRELPADFRREYYIGRVVTTLLSVRARRFIRIVPLRREAAAFRSGASL
jgi:N-acetylglutamate synthase-like GNAT family acetyltransferase